MKPRLVCKLAAVALLLAVTTGCFKDSVLEQLGLVIAFGYDEAPGDRLLGTAVLYEIDPEAREKSNVISATAYTSKGLRNQLNLESRKSLVSGQNRIVIYHENLARNGLGNLVDTLERDIDIGSGLYMAVSKGRAFDLLTRRYREIGNVGEYLYQSVRQNVESEDLVLPILHIFTREASLAGRDPVLPYVVQQDDEIKLDGLALFDAERMVGTLDKEQMFYLRLLRDKLHSGHVEITLPAESLSPYVKPPAGEQRIYIALDHIYSNSRIEMLGTDPLRFRLHMRIRARLQEQSAPIPLQDEKAMRTLEHALADAITASADKLVRLTQKLNVDPIGFGEQYRAKVRHSELTKPQWRTKFPAAKIQLQTSLTILRTGETD